MGFPACDQENDMPATPAAPADARHTPMTFNVVHPAQRKRVTGDAFENGDRVGLFVHAANEPLEIGGNLANNEPLTCGGDGTWTASRTLYWDDGTFNAAFDIETFADDVLPAVDMGATYIGGCCGTNAAYIKRLAEKIREKLATEENA